MSMIGPTLETLMRPSILVRAARCGQAHYRRDRDLPRLLDLVRAPSPHAAVEALAELEAEADATRRSRTETYDMALHVGLLVALLAETRLARSDEGVGL